MRKIAITFGAKSTLQKIFKALKSYKRDLDKTIIPDITISHSPIDLYKTCLGEHLIAYEALKAQKRPSSGDFIEEI